MSQPVKDNGENEEKDKDKVVDSKSAEVDNQTDSPPKPSVEELIKDNAQKLLSCCQKNEWGPVDQILKLLDKQYQSLDEDKKFHPLVDVHDQSTGWSPLMYAVKENKLALIDRLIDLGCDVTTRNKDNFNILHIAAQYSREDVVKLLIVKKNVDPLSTGGPKQQTAIHMVASRQTGTATSILRSLLSVSGKEIRMKTDNLGRIPLLLAVETGNQSMCRELLGVLSMDQLKACNAQGNTALHLAAKKRDLEMVRILIDYGSNVDSQNSDGQTCLHIASSEGDEALVKYLYTVRASATIKDKNDRTPLHLAAEKGHASIIEILADKFKASIFERTKDGSTLMHIASLNGHTDCAAMLFKKGVFLHMPNKDGARSIHTAARYGHVGIINSILQKGEKVDVSTNDNYTALHVAVEAGNPAIVETLLGYGADVHIKGSKNKETPLHIAARVPKGETCALMLLKSGAIPSLPNDDGNTPVHVASQNGNTSTLALLLDNGGDAQYKNKNGETALHLACKNCKPQVVASLINYVKLNNGPDQLIGYVNATDEEGATALHIASSVHTKEVATPLDDIKVVKLLLENGSDFKIQTKQGYETVFHCIANAGNNNILLEVISHMMAFDLQKALNKQNSKGWTPLLIAARKGHREIVNTLLDNHARVDVFDLDGRSALHLAAEKGYLEVCNALLSHQAFINSKSRVGRTALHLAAMNGYPNLVKSLIEDHNAVIDILTLRKQTPLHLAAASGQIEVCRILLELGASIDATDDLGQKPIHAAAQNNHSEVAKLFLQEHPSLVMATSKDGNTCAHIAAAQGSVTVIEELMKFDKQGVINARNKITDATPLQIAAEGGHADVVKALVKAGASCTDENKAGFTAVHLAAKNGHSNVLEVLRSTNTLKIVSKKLGVNALHVAAYFGQADTVRELLTYISGTVKSDSPSGVGLVPALGTESGMTPLHLTSYSGNENVVRLLLNSPGVQVDAATTENGYNSFHLACIGGHMTVVGLLLSRSAELLHSADKFGRTGLHVASTHGHNHMVEVLLGQGAEINATDKNGWTPLHCASRTGTFEVVKHLTESGASLKAETNHGAQPIWFAASEGHNDVLLYLLTKDHNTYELMDDKRFVYNLMVCSKKNSKPLTEFVLVSPAPVDTAAKLSNIFTYLSTKEKEREKDFIAAGKQCETMATELLALAAGSDSAGKILTSVDRRNVEFLDVLIENEQKEVIAHSVVQRYLQEVWKGSLDWNAFKTLSLLLLFIICPPVWVIFALPLGHKYSKTPIIKFMSYLTSHIHLMILLMIVGITPIYPVVRPSLLPYWYEWLLLIWLSGLLLFELTNPSDKSGLGWVRVTVLLFGMFGVGLHVITLLFVEKKYWPTLLYCRNQLFALSFLLASVQILDFLSFHYLFGPWAIIIGNLMKDLARFLAVLAIFVFGFSMHFVALNQPFKNLSNEELRTLGRTRGTQYFSEVVKNPIQVFDLLFFAVFGMTTTEQLKTTDWMRTNNNQPLWTDVLFKVTFAIYMLVSVVVLINLLIAMMTDTYQRIQAQSDIEWKFGLSKLIRSMHRSTTAPSPINLITTWLFYLIDMCKSKLVTKLQWVQNSDFGDELNIGSCKILLHDRCPHEYVSFHFYSYKNGQNSGPELVQLGDSIKDSNVTKIDFNSSLSTKIIIHGYNSDVFIPSLGEVRKEYLKLNNSNIFLIDWSPLGKEPCYFAAVRNSPNVGKCIAQFVNYLRVMNAESIHLIGFSLGAHVAAFAANSLKPYQVSRITGLDPAQPKFMFVDKDQKLDASDAQFVDVYHTNAFLQGISESVGHVDFYMNGGIIQPGCWAEIRFFACNHHRAPLYFAESISNKLGFWGWPCHTYYDYLVGRCVFNGYQVLAGDYTDHNLRGLFLVITSSTSPFALGKYMGPLVEIKNDTEMIKTTTTTTTSSLSNGDHHSHISQFKEELDFYNVDDSFFNINNNC